MDDQWTLTRDQERAYTAGWRAYVQGATMPEEADYPGLREFVRLGWFDADHRSGTRDIHWSHPAKPTQPRPKRP